MMYPLTEGPTKTNVKRVFNNLRPIKPPPPPKAKKNG